MKSIIKNSSAIAFVGALAMLAACSDSENKSISGGITEDKGFVGIKDLDVAGLAQKGPFVKGSEVTAQGVDCKTMKYTDEQFTGKVNSDKGDFGIDDVNFSASCVLFTVSGYYLNEFTGEKSSEKLTLHALTDLSDRETVNINVLTELEYERVMNLVSKEKMSFADAKKQAEKEVLASLGITDLFESFEGLSIYEKGDGNSALLATSVLLQSDLDAKDLTDRMDAVASSIAKTGEWNDEKTKTEMSDWASAAKGDGKFESVRKNLSRWSGSDEIPEFEKVVENFGADSSAQNQDVIPESEKPKAGLPAENLTMTDTRDGKTYKIVKIGEQVWMAENLNYEIDGSFCYKDSAEYCATYGRLYTWAAANEACPEGWHLPTTDEFDTLFTAVGGQSTAAKKLKSTSGWNNNGNGTDDFLFSALPAGIWYGQDEYYNYLGDHANFWSSIEKNSGNANYMNLYSGYDNARMLDHNKDDGMSVRCVRDKREYGTLTDTRDGQTYKTITIGDQEWMAENLNYEMDSSYCYKDSAEYCATYGRLYTWAAANEACPEGWHLPTTDEFDTLFTAVGGQSTAAKKLKSTSGWNNNGNGTDDFLFSALPAGIWYGQDEYYNYLGDHANFWSSIEKNSDNANYMNLYAGYDNARMLDHDKGDGMSVRCVKDKSKYGTLTDARDGQTYKTVKVGGQEWMAENLNYEMDCSYCYKDSTEYCATYGRLYTWAAAMNACPESWHLPTIDEFKTLFDAVGGQSTAAQKLKSTSGWNDDGNGTDDYSFTALPAGIRYGEGAYYNYLGDHANFWSSIEKNSDNASYVNLYAGYDNARLLDHDKDDGMSIRCLKD